MNKQLFFDDTLLFGRDHTKRVYGCPQRIAEYSDGICSTDFCTGNVFRLDNGRYRMLYFGHSKDFDGKKLFSAISDDGVHFVPEKVSDDTEGRYAHEIMTLPNGGEVACIYEDFAADARYKMLMSEFDSAALSVNDTLYLSDDLLHWTKKEGVQWGDGTEPLVSTFYNSHKGCYTVMQRPFWGCRTVGCKTTKDWECFTEYRNLFSVDSNDEALAEIYGMYAFAYDGMYIGIPHVYRDLHSEYNAKYFGGRIDCTLSYSYDGEYWRKSLREPFVSGGEECPMVWLSSITCRDEDILLYGSASEQVHGPAFVHPGQGRLFVYRLRKDGFVALACEADGVPARVITREKIWNGGDVHLNIHAENVTVAVYETSESVSVTGNALGMAKPIEGYTAEDCIPFSGDSNDYIPTFKSGRTLSELVGKTLVFEIRYANGTLYSLSGDYTDAFNTEGCRYRRFGVLPRKWL